MAVGCSHRNVPIIRAHKQKQAFLKMLMIYGDAFPQTLEYQLAFASGAVDVGDPNNDTDDSKDICSRLFANPFRNSSIVDLQGLGFGVAGSMVRRELQALPMVIALRHKRNSLATVLVQVM